MKTKTGAVVHLIHVTTPHQHIAKLFITGIPEDLTSRELQSILDEAGYYYSEFGQKWTNHYVVAGLKDSDISVRKAFRDGKADDFISYKELLERIEKIRRN